MDAALVVQIINLVGLGGLGWLVATFKRAVQAQKDTIDAQKAHLEGMATFLNVADAPKMAERYEAYRQILDAEKDAFIKKAERKLEEENNALRDAAALPQQSLEGALEKPSAEKQKTRSDTEVLEEILAIVRQINIRSANALPVQRTRWEPSEAQKAAALEAATAAPKVLELLSASAVPMFSSAIATELKISQAAAMAALRLLEQRGEAVNARDAQGRRYVTWIAKKG
jgi:hypothetical protein